MARVQSLAFPHYDGINNSEQFFDLVDERGGAEISYLEGTVDDSLGLSSDKDLSPEQVKENYKSYKVMFAEIARCLIGRAITIKKQVKIGDKRSGHVLLCKLKIASGLTEDVAIFNKL